MIDLRREGSVFVLTMNNGENRFNDPFVVAFGRALDEVVAAAGAPAALVITGSGKFFSNGLDLDSMLSKGPAEARTELANALALLARVLTLPVYAVAAMNGHAFGAGALLAVAHDARFMRQDRGFFCMPEVDMGVALHPGMVALLQARLSLQAAHEVVITGTRYGGAAAAKSGIVDVALPEAELLPQAIAAAEAFAAKAGSAMGTLKSSLYRPVLAALASMPDDIFAATT